MAPLPRTYLFVPGNRPERFDKALATGADAVIVDLEDAVPPEGKMEARAAVARWLAPQRPVVVRINAPGTLWFAEDIALCALAGVAAVMVPKAEQVADLHRIATVAVDRPMLPLVETAAGFDNARTLARAEGVQRLVFGSIDFQLDLGMQGGDDELLPFRSQLVLVSRLAGLAPPVDGVTAAIDDAELLARDTARARRLGFGAKLCIHPRQVETVKRGFMATQQELAWARRVLEAAARAHGAAVQLDGGMVDRPVILRAQAIVDEFEARDKAGP
ncbi:MAG TPA: CoA ester lyase [Burkholderiaceae bacterium]|nr:CoA ester lyase [Burkholderiaceae bacterium]